MNKLLFVLPLIFLGCSKQEPIEVAAKGKRHDIVYPTLVITSPTNGTCLPINTQFTVKADAIDNVKIVMVGFIANFPNPYSPYIIPSQAYNDYEFPYEATFVTPNQPCNIVLITYASDGNQQTQRNIYLSCQ